MNEKYPQTNKEDAETGFTVPGIDEVASVDNGEIVDDTPKEIRDLGSRAVKESHKVTSEKEYRDLYDVDMTGGTVNGIYQNGDIYDGTYR